MLKQFFKNEYFEPRFEQTQSGGSRYTFYIGRNMNIYLDNSASTPLDKHVQKTLASSGSQLPGNPSSMHYAGRKSKVLIEDTRHLMAEKLSCAAKEISFTSGGTESNNWALIGAAMANRDKGNHLIVSAAEHPSVLQSARFLEKNGFEIDYIQPDHGGNISIDYIKPLIKKETILISLMYVNNETGAIFPAHEIAAWCQKQAVLFHCDAVQAFGKLPFSLVELPVDLLTVSAHKVYGPAGTGALFIRNGTPIVPLIRGGGQESGRRAGTENGLGIAGLGAALEILDESFAFYETAQQLRDTFENRIQSAFSNAQIIGKETPRLPYISLIAFPGISNESLLMALDMAGIAASAGSACSSGSLRRSHVLEAMDLADEIMDGAVRFSYGKFTTIDEINRAADIVIDLVNRLNGSAKA